MTDRVAYIIVETERDDGGNYIPCIVKEGESGYHPSTYRWGKDKRLAQDCCDEQNEKMGLSKQDVYELVCMSMREQKTEFNPAC